MVVEYLLYGQIVPPCCTVKSCLHLSIQLLIVAAGMRCVSFVFDARRSDQLSNFQPPARIGLGQLNFVPVFRRIVCKLTRLGI